MNYYDDRCLHVHHCHDDFKPQVTKSASYELRVADLKKLLGITEYGELSIKVANGIVTVSVKS